MKLKKELPYLCFILPAFLVYTVLMLYPMLQAVGLSFTDWKGVTFENLHFVGLKNYLDVFSDKQIIISITNTVVYAIAVPIAVTILAIPLSVALNSKMKTSNIQRAAFFFPSVPSALVLGFLWSYIMSPLDYGLLNRMVTGLGFDPVLWLADPKMAMVSVIVVTVWSQLGWHACIYLAQLQSVSEDLYEAARIDGANTLQLFFRITVPQLKPAMVTSVMLLMISSLKVFDLPFALTGGGPGYATTMISQVIIQRGFVDKMYGRSMAAAIVFFLFVAFITAIQQKAGAEKE
ncbi:sugar ABC transporter permease [Schaedlerella arabinosiphila]|uniref:Sugar ABC transporter permease n=1 Tax=Schaedlerella arabinosiphila TaxID=2044587 RepID=A0A426DCR4_9FIRM|nr:sugar ABC transporter permease [Schaedlerella arabinosiphila]RRK30660.1 sugar ABC transporter permease [Schaedlerella arabinosiphila]